MSASHPITIVPATGRVQVRFAGEVIAESDRALALHEANHPPVYYIPRADARLAVLEASPHRTHCPYKGDASYFSIAAGGQRAADAVWSYETPLESMAAIAGHLAFYPDRVEAIEVL